MKCALEHNKEFESFIEKFKEKMDSMQKALQKTQGFDDYLIAIRGITNESTMQLPPNFAIPEAEGFAGIGDPKQCLR